MPLSLRSGLSQRPAPAGTRSAPGACSRRLTAPNARAGFDASARLASLRNDARQQRIVAASAAASSTCFFPSSMDGGKVRVRVRRSRARKKEMRGILPARNETAEEEIPGGIFRWAPLMPASHNPFSSPLPPPPLPRTQQQQQEPPSSSPLARDPLAGVFAAAIQVGLVSLFKRSDFFPFLFLSSSSFFFASEAFRNWADSPLVPSPERDLFFASL